MSRYKLILRLTNQMSSCAVCIVAMAVSFQRDFARAVLTSVSTQDFPHQGSCQQPSNQLTQSPARSDLIQCHTFLAPIQRHSVIQTPRPLSSVISAPAASLRIVPRHAEPETGRAGAGIGMRETHK